jgi:hypothetical protein
METISNQHQERMEHETAQITRTNQELPEYRKLQLQSQLDFLGLLSRYDYSIMAAANEHALAAPMIFFDFCEVSTRVRLEF